MDSPARHEGGLLAGALALAVARWVWRTYAVAGHPARTAYPVDSTRVDQTVAHVIWASMGAVWQTTRQTVQGVLSTAQREDWSSTVTAHQLRLSAGLTPRQQRGLVRLEADLAQQDLSQAEIRRRVLDAAERGLQQRAQLLAATTALRIAHVGAQLAWEHAVQLGYVEGVQKYWKSIHDEKCCDGCAAIEDDYPDGVGLDETFQTDWGDLDTPPAHPRCRCILDYQVP